MTDEKPLTISNLVAALKDAGFATKDDVRAIVKEEVKQTVGDEMAARGLATKNDLRSIVGEVVHDVVYDVLAEFDAGHLQPQFKRIGERFDAVETRLEQLDHRLVGVEREIDGLKAEFSNTPSRGEFEVLKGRVDQLERAKLN